MANDCLSLSAVALSFPGPTGPIAVLDSVDFSLSRGEICLLKGRSGGGKTSLLHLLGGLLEPSGGAVCWRGRSLRSLGRRRDVLRGRTLGFVFQDHCLLPSLTVLENVLLPWRIGGTISRRDALDRGRALLAAAELLDRADSAVEDLSGGERQRVAVARALLQRPPFLLADEPTGSLDGAAEARVRDLLLELREGEGSGLLIVSHGDAFDCFADRTLFLEGGRIVSP